MKKPKYHRQIRQRIYLDYAATAPADPAVIRAMLPYFNNKFGNPSSLHHFGQEAYGAIEEARAKVAKLIGAHKEEVFFTSGGTEADNYALIGTAYANKAKGDHLITSAIEHHAVLETMEFLKHQGFQVTILPVDKEGFVDPADLEKAITDRTILVSIMHANNEVGTIQPINQLAAMARHKGVIFHTDGVQTVGHIPVDVRDLGVDLLSLSAHKFYGPKGVGAVFIRKGTRIQPFIHGGAQEKERRAGTENVPGIVGLGWAAELALMNLPSEGDHARRLRNRLLSGIERQIDHIVINGPRPAIDKVSDRRLPGNASVSIEFIEGEALLMSLDLAGIAASTGSACSSKSLEPSHVLKALGLPTVIARGSIRFSLGKFTTGKDINAVLKVLPPIVAQLRKMSPLYSHQI